MKMQELVYNRSNLIRSQVGFVSTFGCVLQFHIFLSFSLFFQLMCVFSSVQAKSETEQCQCAFMYHSSAQTKESAIIMCAFSLVLAYVSVYILVCICMFLHVYVFAKGCISVSLSVCAGGEWGSVVCLCVEGPGCSPDFSWELQWSMSSAEYSNSRPPTS